MKFLLHVLVGCKIALFACYTKIRPWGLQREACQSWAAHHAVSASRKRNSDYKAQQGKHRKALGRHQRHLACIFYGSGGTTSTKQNIDFWRMHPMALPTTHPIHFHQLHTQYFAAAQRGGKPADTLCHILCQKKS